MRVGDPRGRRGFKAGFRLRPLETSQVIRAAYEQERASTNESHALKVAQELLIMSSEFHATGAANLTPVEKPSPPPPVRGI